MKGSLTPLKQGITESDMIVKKVMVEIICLLDSKLAVSLMGAFLLERKLRLTHCRPELFEINSWEAALFSLNTVIYRPSVEIKNLWYKSMTEREKLWTGDG